MKKVIALGLAAAFSTASIALADEVTIIKRHTDPDPEVTGSIIVKEQQPVVKKKIIIREDQPDVVIHDNQIDEDDAE